MVFPRRRTLWDSVIELTKMAQENSVDPRLWASQLSSNLKFFSVEFPSTELAEVIVSYICWDNNVPILWKFLERAMALNLVSPLVVLALLTDRVVPCRSTQLQAYRIYLELLKRNMFTIKDHISGSHYEKRIIPGTVLNNYRICLMRCFKETLGHSLHHLAPLQILLPLVVLYLIQMISGHRSRQVQWGLIMILSDFFQELIMPSR